MLASRTDTPAQARDVFEPQLKALLRHQSSAALCVVQARAHRRCCAWPAATAGPTLVQVPFAGQSGRARGGVRGMHLTAHTRPVPLPILCGGICVEALTLPCRSCNKATACAEGLCDGAARLMHATVATMAGPAWHAVRVRSVWQALRAAAPGC